MTEASSKDEVVPDEAELRSYVGWLLGKKSREWWVAPNPMLGGLSPTTLEITRKAKLYAFIRAAKEANGD